MGHILKRCFIATARRQLTNSSDERTYLLLLNVPLLSRQELTQKFQTFPDLLSSKMQVKPQNNTGTCGVCLTCNDLTSALRCRDSMNGLPFSPRHNIGPVRIAIRQVAKEQWMQARQAQRKPEEVSPQAPQSNLFLSAPIPATTRAIPVTASAAVPCLQCGTQGGTDMVR
jgi:hypothetical protein